MGLDLYLKKDPCKTCGHQEKGFSARYTYNASPIWHAIYPDDDGMVQIDGMSGAGAIYKLEYAMNYMVHHEEELRKLEPSNGWGSFIGFYQFLAECRNACLAYPDCIWMSWR